jgi:hypothetical protein
MNGRLVVVVGLGMWLALAAGARPAVGGSSAGLKAFASDAQIRAYLKRLAAQRRGSYAEAVAPPPPPPPPPPGSVVVTGSRIPQPNLTSSSPITIVSSSEVAGITNNQVASVDEGDIVKVRGDLLVVLRRGRLFTLSLADGGLRPVDSINAFPPGVSGQGDWYDEMLLSGDRVIVIGYSYARGGTEVNRFHLGPDGKLRWQDSYHLRSNDYYSSRNYASRLIGDRLIIYSPLYLDRDPIAGMPALSRWRTGQTAGPFRRIATARQIYMPPVTEDGRELDVDALHTVISCDLAAAELDCTATGVLGPEGRTFFVSANAVYIWTAGSWIDEADEVDDDDGVLYRLPLDGGRPAAVSVRGQPVDQFSFQAEPGDSMLDVLVRTEGGGDAMWHPEVTGGATFLVRIAAASFGEGRRPLPGRHYRLLPKVAGESWNFHNRFVGGMLLYGGGAFGAGPRPSGAELVAVPVRGGRPIVLRVPNAVERIEALGEDGLVVGAGENDSLGFSAIDLRSGGARVGDVFRLPAAQEGETRSHAFFFRPDAATPDGASGILGLPVARPAPEAYRRFLGNSAAMLFLRRNARRFAPAGEIAAKPEGAKDDNCQASCVDWYGNARPIFLGDRVFALLGYELVEGRLEDGRIREVRRVSFAPAS